MLDARVRREVMKCVSHVMDYYVLAAERERAIQRLLAEEPLYHDDMMLPSTKGFIRTHRKEIRELTSDAKWWFAYARQQMILYKRFGHLPLYYVGKK